MSQNSIHSLFEQASHISWIKLLIYRNENSQFSMNNMQDETSNWINHKKKIIVFIDYNVTIFIACQIRLTLTTSMNKLNLQLVCVLQYLSQFNIDVWYCFDKIHLVLNILLWLLNNMMNKIKKDIINILKNLAIEFYHVTLIELADKFKKYLQNMYKKDIQWKQIIDIIKLMNCSSDMVNKDMMKWSVKLHFTYWNSLIYYINDVNKCKCLCISAYFKRKIFKLTHNWQHHTDFHQIYD